LSKRKKNLAELGVYKFSAESGQEFTLRRMNERQLKKLTEAQAPALINAAMDLSDSGFSDFVAAETLAKCLQGLLRQIGVSKNCHTIRYWADKIESWGDLLRLAMAVLEEEGVLPKASEGEELPAAEEVAEMPVEEVEELGEGLARDGSVKTTSTSGSAEETSSAGAASHSADSG
jgi:hypothetical protein